MQFGTSGLRGLVSDMTDAVCASYARAFIDHLRDAGTLTEILVGRDLRPSSLRIAEACCGAGLAAGATAIDCGVVPTPALALEAARRGAAAIMVTGSHIPFDRNGLKFYGPAGEITKADEAAITARLAMPDHREHPGGELQKACDIGERYVARYVAFFGRGSLQGLRIGVYQHSAAGRDLLVQALAELGGRIVALGRTDDFVPIDTEAVSPQDAARIRTWVAEHRLSALVSTDGDGDRPLIADESGAVLRGDAVGTLAAHALGADAVAAPLNASTALERSGWFARVARTRIGSPFVIAALAALSAGGARCPVGYEPNGGFLLGGDVEAGGRRLAALPTRDALLPILVLLAAATREGVPLSALAARLPRRFTASDRLQEIPASKSGPLLSTLAASEPARSRLLAGLGGEPAAIDTRDGVRMTLSSGDIVHLRMSGNAPELRCYAEAADAGQAQALVAEVLRRISAALA